MRSGDVRCVWLLLALTAGCERRAAHRAPPTPETVAPPTGLTAAAVVPAPQVGCDPGWWPLAAGQRWRWRIERSWVDGDSGRVGQVTDGRDVEVRAEGSRFVVTGWPAPWTAALTAPIVVELDGSLVRTADVGDRTTRPWFELGREAHLAGVDRRVIDATADRPAELELVWRAMADDVSVRLRCGVGPVGFEYHHHGTLEELRATRIDRIGVPLPRAPSAPRDP